MADNRSARLALPFIESGQAQKEVTHNEALALLDIAVQPDVEAVGVDVPPASPVAGQCWVVGTAPVGAWAGQAGRVAGWTDGGWRFLTVREGARVWDRSTSRYATRSAGTWESGVVRGAKLVVAGKQVVAEQRPAIVDPAGGSSVDAQARAAIGAILAALRAHGLVAS